MDDRLALLLKIRESMSTVPPDECKILADWYEDAGFPWYARLWRNDVELWIRSFAGMQVNNPCSGEPKEVCFCRISPAREFGEKRQTLLIIPCWSIAIGNSLTDNSNVNLAIGQAGMLIDWQLPQLRGMLASRAERCTVVYSLHKDDSNALLSLAANYMMSRVLNDPEVILKGPDEPFRNCIDNLREVKNGLVAYLVNHPENRWNRRVEIGPNDWRLHIGRYHPAEEKAKIKWFTD